MSDSMAKDNFDKTFESLKRTIIAVAEVLDECEDYFEQRQDADHNGHSYVPNEEMRLLQMIRQARRAR